MCNCEGREHRTGPCYLCRALAERVANDSGVRHDLDDVIEEFGFTRAELEADDQ